VNARLRQVVADKDEQLAGRDELIALQARQIDALSELNGLQGKQIETQNEQIETLQELVKRLTGQNAEFERRLAMNSRNSSTPSSRDSIADKAEAKAERKKDLSSRERSKDRKPGGQPGHKGKGLLPEPEPDRVEPVEAPEQCGHCDADLGDAMTLADGWAQVWDITDPVLEKVQYTLPRRKCCGCGATTTAAPPFGRAGTVSYGPNLNTAAVLLGSEGNVPVERTAMLMHMMLGVAVSAGFVARAAARLAAGLSEAGFDESMKAALRAEDVLCADESPVNVWANDIDPGTGSEVAGAPHAVTLRSTDARLVWYAAMTSRSAASIAALGVLSGWQGHLVRDDYRGWHQFDAELAGVQQCCAHLIRHAKGVLELHPTHQQWAGQVIAVLREAAAAVEAARAAGADHLDPALLAALRARYDEAVSWGAATNRHRDWHNNKKHPGYVLAQRLADKIEQVWLFTRNFKAPWTNNASEQALRNPKRHQAVSGYWHTTTTLRNDLRIRSYLTSARGHGLRAMEAIHAALNGRPWLPTAAT
jgi:transposase